MLNTKDFVLLLTACVSPNGMSFTVVQDPMERKKAYLESLKYYLDATRFRIVFCNNSGEDLSGELLDKDGRVEFLSFYGNDYDKSFGKGYGEFGIIQYAMQHSRFIYDATYIVKITGKLKITNLLKAIKISLAVLGKKPNLLFVNLINEKNGGVADSRYFVSTKDFYNRFLGRKNNINDAVCYYFERLLYDVVEEAKDDFIVLGFAIPLAIEGQSWTSGEEYCGRKLNWYDELIYCQGFCKEYKKQTNEKSIRRRLAVVSTSLWMIRLNYRLLKKVGRVLGIKKKEID